MTWACDAVAQCDDDINDVLKRVLVEQLLSTMPEDLRVWVAERKPITGSNTGELADNYLQVRQQATRMGGDGEKTGPRKQCHRCGSTGYLVQNCPQKSITKDADGNKEQKEQNGQEEHPDGYKKIICFNCKKRGHFSYNCPDIAGFCV